MKRRSLLKATLGILAAPVVGLPKAGASRTESECQRIENYLFESISQRFDSVTTFESCGPQGGQLEHMIVDFETDSEQELAYLGEVGNSYEWRTLIWRKYPRVRMTPEGKFRVNFRFAVAS